MGIPNYTVYILRTSGNTLYTGITNNLEKRLRDHAAGRGAKYLRKYPSFTLVYTESCATKGDALRREAFIKSLGRPEKDLLLNR